LKLHNHAILTTCIVYSVTGNMIGTCAAAAGSLLPAVAGAKHHRYSHFIWPWVLVTGLAWYLLRAVEYRSLPLYIAFFLLSGAVLHILTDVLGDAGIPALSPEGEKYALGLYKSGTRWETITLMGLLAVFGGFAFLQGYLSAVHVLTQLKLLAQFI
jgi:membrane-bound metal-dependent hydrolase YbcI (DUF457 family)